MSLSEEIRRFPYLEGAHSSRARVRGWADQVEAMQRRIAELEAALRPTVQGLPFKAGSDSQADRDRAVIEAARAYLTSYVANEPITGYKMATQRADLFHAIRLYDEKVNGHE